MTGVWAIDLSAMERPGKVLLLVQKFWNSKMTKHVNEKSRLNFNRSSNTSQQNKNVWVNKEVSIYQRVGLDEWKPKTNFGEIAPTSFRAFPI